MKHALLISCLLFIADVLLAQFSKADVSITLMALAPYITPSGKNHKIADNSPYVGYIQYDLQQLAKGETKTLELVYQRCTSCPNKVTAYIYSTSSDSNPGNNYKEANY